MSVFGGRHRADVDHFRLALHSLKGNSMLRFRPPHNGNGRSASLCVRCPDIQLWLPGDLMGLYALQSL